MITTPMKSLSICAILAIIHMTIAAQTVQNGIVLEYNEASPKTALPGVELRVYPAQSTVSDINGKFQLEFLTLNPGERINVRRIEKNGYEIFNKDALEQWNLNPNMAFSVVMCQSDKFKHLKDLYYANSEERYSRQYRTAQANLLRLRDENRIQQQEFADSLRKIENIYALQLENLDNYVDRFARIDLSEISSFEQEIIALVQEGKIDEAISKYDELNVKDKLVFNIRQRNQVRAAISQLSDVDSAMTLSTDSLYAVAERQIQTLLLAGDYRNNEKIKDIYCEIANADSTNINWLRKTGTFMRDYLSNFPMSLEYFQRAIRNSEKLEQADKRAIADVYGEAGNSYREIGDFELALQYLNKDLLLYREALGEDSIHEDLAPIHCSIGVAYAQKGDYENAIKHIITGISISENIPESNKTNLATAYSNLGVIYSNINEFSKSQEMFDKALTLASTYDIKDHVLANAYNGIGTMLASKGNLAQALVYFEKSKDIAERIFGSIHPDYLQTINNIGYIQTAQGNDAEALDYFTEGLDIAKQIYPHSHPTIATIMSNISTIYGKQGNSVKSLEIRQEALELQKEVLPENHPDIAQTYQNIGADLLHLQQFDDALIAERKAIEIYLETIDENSPQIAFSYKIISEILLAQENLPEALDYIQRAVDIYKQTLDSNNPNLGKSYLTLGRVYASLEDYENSYDSYMRGLKILEPILSSDNPLIPVIYNHILFALHKSSQNDSAVINKMSDFMSDKIWVGISNDDGLLTDDESDTTECIILEYGEWNIEDVSTPLPYTIEILEGKEKDVLYLHGTSISKHTYNRNNYLLNYFLKKIASEDKAQIIELYQQWKENKEANND